MGRDIPRDELEGYPGPASIDEIAGLSEVSNLHTDT